MRRAPAPLPLIDHPERYGLVSRALHWLSAALILWQLASMILKLWLGRGSPVAAFMTGTHQPVGTLLALVLLVRLIWALCNRHRRPAHGSGFWAMAARLGHGALYLCMALVPLSALMRAWGNGRSFAPFGFEIFPARTEPVTWAVGFGDALHGELAWVMALLILGHVGMVAVHQLIWKDKTLARMIGR